MRDVARILASRNIRLLWTDLRYNKDAPCLDERLTGIHDVEVITDFREIDAAVTLQQPDILCFDFDLPDQAGLSALHDIKTRYPALPFIVLTKDHSVELAIWALRMRAWDYFIKPVSVEELAGSIGELPQRCSMECTERRKQRLPEPVLPAGPGPLRANMCKASTALALSYVRQQYHNKVTLDEVAKLCGMSRSHFSRSFRNEHGFTFQEFLTQQRISKAVDLLGNSDLQVTHVALAVGFTELSNFTRTFQRIIGVLPSCYRKALSPKQLKKAVVGQSLVFPRANPNPVLSTGRDGALDFLNPAALQLLDELALARVEDMLPHDHGRLLKDCLESDIALTDERKVGGRTIVWSYHANGNSEVVYIYGHDVSGYISHASREAALSGVNTAPVFSSIPDGTLRFVNPEAFRLLKELELETAEDILPDNHEGLIKACRKTGATFTKERERAGRTISWSYHPVSDSSEVYIYGHDVSGLQ